MYFLEYVYYRGIYFFLLIVEEFYQVSKMIDLLVNLIQVKMKMIFSVESFDDCMLVIFIE